MNINASRESIKTLEEVIFFAMVITGLQVQVRKKDMIGKLKVRISDRYRLSRNVGMRQLQYNPGREAALTYRGDRCRGGKQAGLVSDGSVTALP
jgi:hypothetical protein